MKLSKILAFLILAMSLSGIFLSSCKSGGEDNTTGNSYYLSSETKVNLSVSDIKANLNELIPNFSTFFGSIISSDVQVQKVVYKTTFQNKTIEASGLACFPKTPGNYPILSFQNGTNTVYKDAPTENPSEDNILMLESLASTGFIVVIPDYIGFGVSTSLPHPYLDAKSSTQSILDMIRATKELATDDKIVAKPTKDLFIFGYSQGGWATLQLQRTIEKEYSSEFNLIASSCGAGPYSIEYMTDYVLAKDVYPMPYFLAYVLNSYINIGSITNPLSDFFQATYAAKIPGLFDGLHTGGEINAALTTQIPSLLTTDFRTSYTTVSKFAAFKSVINSNSVKAWSLSTPTKLFHGASDDYIPPGISSKMYSDFMTADSNNSTKLELRTVPGDHSTAVSMVAFQTLSWFLQIKK
ncbi:MAG TPA: lipase family protein [Prolixibacteraceae bacterium]|nr:lipase family protein [Prolixibacteraceae bacterium]HPR85323.1 lipase family protein [Prolixibacteraceae bacterium]